MSQVMARAKYKNKSMRVNLSPGRREMESAINHQRPRGELKPPENPKGGSGALPIREACGAVGRAHTLPFPAPAPLRPLPSGCSRVTSFYDKLVTW